MLMEYTTVKLSRPARNELEEFREYPRESLDGLVRKIIHIAKLSGKNPRLSQRTVMEIREARKRIQKGRYYTQAEVGKSLGI